VDGKAVIEVEDNGPGVPADQRDRIFEPFVSTKGAAGNGLGLWISAEIARRHGGSLTVDAAPGGGAVFRLTLPLRTRTETPPSRILRVVGESEAHRGA
jgi:signal transduction histidine kinase